MQTLKTLKTIIFPANMRSCYVPKTYEFILFVKQGANTEQNFCVQKKKKKTVFVNNTLVPTSKADQYTNMQKQKGVVHLTKKKKINNTTSKKTYTKVKDSRSPRETGIVSVNSFLERSL